MDEVDIMNLMNDIEYGYVSFDNIIYRGIDKLFSLRYVLQSPLEVVKNKIGVCWDQVELERYYFDSNGFNIKTYFIVYYDKDSCPTHTFLTFKKCDKYYWFEHAWEKFVGIYEYDDMDSLLRDVRDKFIRFQLDDKCVSSNLLIYEYKTPKYHIGVREFYSHCESGNVIKT